MFSYTEKISAILIVKERILTAYSLDSPYKNIWFLVLLLKENKKYFLKYIKNKWHILSMSIYIYFKEIVSITGRSSCASLTKICFHFITDYILLSPLKSCMYFCGVWPISGTHSQEQKKKPGVSQFAIYLKIKPLDKSQRRDHYISSLTLFYFSTCA